MTAGIRSRSLYGWPLLLAALAVLGAGAWYYFWREDSPNYTFETATIDSGRVEQSVSATGSVQALITVDLSSQLSGQIADVKVDFNSKVKAGDLLAVVDKKTFQARVKSAEANLEMAIADVAVQNATIKKNGALTQKAEEDLARQQQLAERGASSQSVLSATKTALTAAEADLSIAKAQLQNAIASVAQRRSDLDQAKIDLERTEIRSPIDGIVIARNIDPGATVAASLSAPVLFRIAQDLSKIQLATLVDEADIGRIEMGNTVTFTVDAHPDQTFAGRVDQVRIGGTNENNVVTYTVIVRADNPREKLLPGMTATARIVTGRKEGVLRVANAAIRFRPPQGVPGAETVPHWGRNEAFLAELAELLNLTKAQQDKLKSALDEARARRIEAEKIVQNAPGTPASERRGRRRTGEQSSRRQESGGGRPRGNLARILGGIMTAEQAKIFAKWREERRETTRPAVVWLVDGGKLLPRRIRLGLADEAYSEIAGGILKKGDKVVTRVRTGKKR